jgi:tetratricopeptide (TPR) repeat protein
MLGRARIIWRGVVAARAKHLAWYLELAEEAERSYHGPAELAWLARVERETDNLRAALQRASETGDAEVGVRLGAALWWWWLSRGHVTEGRRFLAPLLARPAPGRTAARAWALSGAGSLAKAQADYPTARALIEAGLALFRELGDKRGIAASLINLGYVVGDRGDPQGARALFQEGLALARAEGDRYRMAIALCSLGGVVAAQGEYGPARALLGESLVLSREIGDKAGTARCLNFLGYVLQQQGQFGSAQPLHDEAMALFRELGDKWGMASSLYNLGPATK